MKQPCSNPKSEPTRNVTRREMLTVAAATTVGLGSSSTACGDGPVGKLVQIGQRTRTCDSELKRQAAANYHASFADYGGQLSNPIRHLFLTAQNPEVLHFGVVVIGSGYGASIAAARLSQRLRPEHRICILERGKEWIPGTFPDTAPRVFGNTTCRLTGPARGQTSQPLGLFNITMGDEINLLGGNGLGGGSLINASIALRPHPDVFQQCRWPLALRDVEVLGPFYDQVAASMSLTQTPFDQTPKVRRRRLAAERMSQSLCFFDRSNESVMYDFRHLDQQMRNRQGVIQRPCTLCGDCITGCNVGAKNSLTMNYLPVAKHNGTEIYTQVEVKLIEKVTGFYRIHLEYIDDSGNEITRHPVCIQSQMVVVGAGSPGTAAILMESQTDGFCFSPKLGQNWSGNGDTLGFVTRMQPGTNIGGKGAYQACGNDVGPTVQTSLIYHRDIEMRKRLVIQDAAIPRGVSNLFAVLLGDAELNESMAMLGMGHDGANGRIEKRDGRWQIKWDGLKESAYRRMVFGEFERLAAAHGGKYKRLEAFGDNMVTVHPLGGCGMSDDPCQGTTNHLGQVYDLAAGGSLDSQTGQPLVHHGLYVADASVMPTALGVNPYMTIGALSERIARHIVTNPAHQNLFV